MAAVFGQMLGLGVVGGTGNHAWLASTRSTSRGNRKQIDDDDIAKGAKLACYSHVYLDRVRIYGGRTKEPLFDISAISPDRIEAIEVYTSSAQVPDMYAGLNTSCGVVVIWTRRTFPPDSVRANGERDRP